MQGLDFFREGPVGFDVDAGDARELGELLTRQPGELFAELVAVAGERLVDVLDQKNVPLACALTSADAVNGMRVV